MAKLTHNGGGVKALIIGLVTVFILFFVVSLGNTEDSLPLLTIEGGVPGEPVNLDLAKIMQLPSKTFVRANRWTKKDDKYTGVLLKELFVSLGCKSRAGLVEVIAGDDYKALIKLEDIYAYDYLLSYKKNDKMYSELSLKENRGPLAIVINFDKYASLDFEIYKHHQVWFVEKIVFKE